MSIPRLYSLGAAVMDSAFYADCPLSKNALAQALKTSRPTIWRYENIAYWAIADFKEDYPKLPKELWETKGCSRDREVPLSPYQSWVVSVIKECYSHLRKKSAVEDFIKANSYLLSRRNYQSELTKLAKMATAA